MRPTSNLTKTPSTVPEVRKHNAEQAALFLLGYAFEGDLNARDLLEIIFPNPQKEVRVAPVRHS